MKKLIYLICLSFFFSCNEENGVFVELKNKSEYYVENLVFGTFEDKMFSYEKIQSNEQIQEFIELSEIHKNKINYKISYRLHDGRTVVSAYKSLKNKKLKKRIIKIKIENEVPQIVIKDF